jgi:Flp pilus assembly CpaF family ATPase
VTQRVPYRAIAQAINLVVFIERTPEGRRVRSVTRVLGWGDDGYRLAETAGGRSTGLSALIGK